VKYDFDRVVDRKNTFSRKWEKNTELFGTEDVLDMWVADMDFPCPEPVVRAVMDRAAHPIYGYTFPPDSLYEAIQMHLEKHYGWKVKKEWITFTSGVVNGLYTAVQTISHPGDEIIVQPPVYYPFYGSIKNVGCSTALNPLKFDGERYTMDIDNLRDLFRSSTRFPAKTPRIKGLVLCSPHNPVGRVWTRDELAEMAEVCLQNRCVIMSDEIHCDLLVRGAKHTVTSMLSKEVEQNTITLMAASKTFNLAGLSTGFVIIPNDDLRREYTFLRAGQNSGNLFGYAALEAAFRYGDEYMDQVREYLNGNIDLFVEYIDSHVPGVKVIRPEGTYLVWVDLRGLGLSPIALQTFMRDKARLALDDGFAFGLGGEGFQRFNMACPRSFVMEALTRLEKAVKDLRGGAR